MSHFDSIDSLKLLTNLPEELGMKGFKVSFHESAGFTGISLRFKVSKDLIISKGASEAEILRTLTQCISESIIDSTIHKTVVNAKDEKIEELQKEVEELQKYKTHFNLQRLANTPVDLNTGTTSKKS